VAYTLLVDWVAEIDSDDPGQPASVREVTR
jgi:hypothetical protein